MERTERSDAPSPPGDALDKGTPSADSQDRLEAHFAAADQRAEADQQPDHPEPDHQQTLDEHEAAKVEPDHQQTLDEHEAAKVEPNQLEPDADHQQTLDEPTELIGDRHDSDKVADSGTDEPAPVRSEADESVALDEEAARSAQRAREDTDGGDDGDADVPTGAESLSETDERQFEDLGRQVRENLDPGEWKAADSETRRDMLDSARGQLTSSLGLAEGPALTYDESMEECGTFDPDTRQITIQDQLVDEADPEEALRTVVHEVRHDYQGSVMNGSMEHPSKEEWLAADASYDPDDFDSYMENALEIDSFAVEDPFMRGFKGDKR